MDSKNSKRVKDNENVSEEKIQHGIPETVKNEAPSKKSISAYMVKPNNVHFETQERKEKIILLLRRHFITNVNWILAGSILLMMPVVLASISYWEYFPVRYQVVLLVMWYLFCLAFIFEKFLSWYYNVFIITDERIVDVDFYTLMYKEVSQAKIDNIQDVTFVMGGLMHTIFNYGTVFIQTAGEQRELDFNEVPHPDKVAKVLNELMLEEEREKLEGRVN